MANVTTKTAAVTFVLELSVEEAQYVVDALRKFEPVHLEEDTVYDALTDAMVDTDVDFDFGASKLL
jgi:hypothetical protein